MTMTHFDEQYLTLAWWVQNGRIEIGHEEYGDSFIRVIDEGSTIRESDKVHETVAAAVDEAEAAIRRVEIAG